MAGDFGEDFGLLEILLILAAVGGIGYAIYYLVTQGPLASGSSDPGGGAPSTGILGSAVNQLEVGSSSLSFSDAAQQFFGNPLTTLATIFGLNQDSSNSTASDSGDNDGTN